MDFPGHFQPLTLTDHPSERWSWKSRQRSTLLTTTVRLTTVLLPSRRWMPPISRWGPVITGLHTAHGNATKILGGINRIDAKNAQGNFEGISLIILHNSALFGLLLYNDLWPSTAIFSIPFHSPSSSGRQRSCCYIPIFE